MIKEIILKIFSARWLVTVSLSTTFCYMAWVDKISAEVFVPVFIVVLNYYFKEKKRKEENGV